MKTMPSADFRRDYATLTEPVVVTANRRTLGTWIPLGVDGQIPPNGRFMPASRDEFINGLNEEIKHLKQELAKREPPDFVSGPVVVTSSERVLEDTTLDHLRRNRQATIDATLGKLNRKKEKA